MGNQKKYSLMVLVPSRGLLITESIKALMRELNNTKKYIKKWDIRFSDNMTVDKARQWLAQEFIDSGYDHALWMDDDQVLSEGLLGRLFKADADFATCHVVNRSPKNIQPGATPQNRMKPIFWFPPDNMRKDFNTGKLTFISLAVALTKRKLFDDIPRPWFKSELDKNLPARYWEDGFFSDKMLKYQGTKFKVVVLPEFCPHWELVEYAGVKGSKLKLNSYFHSSVQNHKFISYDKDTLFPQLDNESTIYGSDRRDIHSDPRFSDPKVLEMMKKTKMLESFHSTLNLQ